jgi:hypothetical protein
VPGELAGRALVRIAGAAQRREDVELALAQAVAAVDDAQLLGEVGGEPVQPPDDALRRDGGWP